MLCRGRHLPGLPLRSRLVVVEVVGVMAVALAAVVVESAACSVVPPVPDCGPWVQSAAWRPMLRLPVPWEASVPA